MKYLKKFETNSQFNAWRNTNPELNPYACFSMESGITYYQEYLNANGFEYVNLGLPSGTLWATMNIGSNSLDNIGILFSWGETYATGKTSYEEEDYDFYVPNSEEYSKYNQSDGKFRLDLEDDAARCVYGGSWFIPTSYQYSELVENCTVSVSTISGTTCCIFTSTINGNTLTFPLVANQNGSQYDSAYYWCCELADEEGINASALYLYPNDTLYFFDTAGTSRYRGWPVRPVLGDRDWRPVYEGPLF